MKDEAIAPFIEKTKKLEGVVPFPYLDIVGLVTVATGNLIDSGPHPPALKPYKAPTHATAPLLDFDRNALFKEAAMFDWRKVGVRAGLAPASEDDPIASVDEFKEEWRRIKTRRDLALKGGAAFASVATLRLTATGIDHLFMRTMRAFESTLRKQLTNWDELPASAQLATMLMAWGLGPSFPAKWPKWRAAMLAQDFVTAAAESQSKTFSADRNREVRDALLEASEPEECA